MANIFVKKEVCPTCNGEKSIICCSCSADDECHEMVCPSCHGSGYNVSYNTPAIIGAVCVGVVVLVGVFFSYNSKSYSAKVKKLGE